MVIFRKLLLWGVALTQADASQEHCFSFLLIMAVDAAYDNDDEDDGGGDGDDNDDDVAHGGDCGDLGCA